MGEDFLRKKTDQFIRLRNRGYERLIKRNLFSSSPAQEAIEMTGSLCASNPPPTGTRVWAQIEEDGSVCFFAGPEACVRVPEARARDLRPLIERGTIIGEILASDPEFGHIRLRLTLLHGDVDERSAGAR